MHAPIAPAVPMHAVTVCRLRPRCLLRCTVADAFACAAVCRRVQALAFDSPCVCRSIPLAMPAACNGRIFAIRVPVMINYISSYGLGLRMPAACP